MVRIQLASNYQVVELTADSVCEIDECELQEAISLVNRLGKEVEITINNKPTQQKVEKPASEKQIKWVINLGCPEKIARRMSSKEAWKYITENKDNPVYYSDVD